ncbi:hypothetical protein GCM10010441_49500 [Kitasatospora paracochleata]|uniref:Pyrroloquinoline-quinone binding quinoprotein n=1 Tax=Kitasatospora paracochleata TaxID=58354 RepID=A0ABT1IU75_9ACTN|nr:PQQ-like beta-propeller repeat protein [Kitasatospora paracochleata]MCP2308141.1 hypothetical protein [Kitasatospora paracochleata]
MSSNPLRSLSPRSVLPALAVLLVLGAGAAAHANRPVPFGDRVVDPGGADASPVGAQSLDAGALEFKVGPGLEAYDRGTGQHLWSYRREGATALHTAMVGENAVVVWDDGMVTSVHPSDHSVRWHRSVPGLADWLRADGEPGAADRTDTQKRDTALKRAAAALQPGIEEEPWVAVVTPSLTMGFRERDGDLRFNSRPATGCSYDPLRAVHTANAMLVPRTCTGTTGASHPLPGGISGFQLSGHGWQLNAGPDVQLRQIDAHRVSIEDGPIIGSRVFDTTEGSPETACGSPAEPFAAVSPTCSK